MGSVSTGKKTGQLMSSGLYKNVKMYGTFISYYENGHLESESIIQEGVEELKFYDKEGNFLSEVKGC